MLFPCEQMCPTGAIEVHWEVMEKLENETKAVFTRLARPLMKYKNIRGFRSLVSTDEEAQAKPLYKITKHPRLILIDGVVKVRS